jgi:hypothetical protein
MPILSGSFGALSCIVALVGPLSAAFGCGSRVLYLKRQLENLRHDPDAARNPQASPLPSRQHTDENDVVQLSNICVRVPHSDQELLSGLCLRVPRPSTFTSRNGFSVLNISIRYLGTFS